MRTAAAEADLAIAEVGAWSNPLSPDDATRKAAVEKCQACLAYADELGARCCVNIAGSRGESWDGPHADDLTEDTFALVVDTVRGIIDAVNPMRTYYTLETMPWMYPNSADAYQRLIKAIDRDRFAVHFDPVNLVCSPERYFHNGALIRDFVDKLGPHIRSCHGKDVILHEKFLTHLDEVRPGLGTLDYGTFLTALDALDADIPVMLEHLSTPDEYGQAADYVRSVADHEGVALLSL